MAHTALLIVSWFFSVLFCLFSYKQQLLLFKFWLGMDLSSPDKQGWSPMRTTLSLESTTVGGPQTVMASLFHSSCELSRVLGSTPELLEGNKPQEEKPRPRSWSAGLPKPLAQPLTARPGLPEIWSWTNGRWGSLIFKASTYLKCMILRISSTWWLKWKNRGSTKDPTSLDSSSVSVAC